MEMWENTGEDVQDITLAEVFFPTMDASCQSEIVALKVKIGTGMTDRDRSTRTNSTTWPSTCARGSTRRGRSSRCPRPRWMSAALTRRRLRAGATRARMIVGHRPSLWPLVAIQQRTVVKDIGIHTLATGTLMHSGGKAAAKVKIATGSHWIAIAAGELVIYNGYAPVLSTPTRRDPSAIIARVSDI